MNHVMIPFLIDKRQARPVALFDATGKNIKDFRVATAL